MLKYIVYVNLINDFFHFLNWVLIINWFLNMLIQNLNLEARYTTTHIKQQLNLK